jgi:hypothetical protein
MLGAKALDKYLSALYVPTNVPVADEVCLK